MTIESAINTGLTAHFVADSNLSALTVPVYPHVAPQGSVYPFVIYTIINSSVDKALDPASAQLTLTSIDIELGVYADSVSTRSLLMTSIKSKLHGFRGALGTENLDIRESFLQSLSTFSEADLTGSDEQIYRASMSFNIFYNWS